MRARQVRHQHHGPQLQHAPERQPRPFGQNRQDCRQRILRKELLAAYDDDEKSEGISQL
jgi:hypothetical protein